MSSLVRRLQIRILKSKGFVRQTQKVVTDPITLEPRLVPCKRVMTNEGVSIAHWPRATKRPEGYSLGGLKPARA